MKSGSLQPDHNPQLAKDQTGATNGIPEGSSPGCMGLEAFPEGDRNSSVVPVSDPQAAEAAEGGITMQEAVALAMGSKVPAERVTRVQARVLCSALVEVRWKGPDGCTEFAVANMEEIWQSGASLDLEVSVPEGVSIRLRHGSDVLEARVLYCQQNLTGYSLGVQFTGASFWSPERFVPSHAVELGALGKEMGGLGKESALGETDVVPPPDEPGLASRAGVALKQRPSQALVPRPLTMEGLSPLISRGSLVALSHQFVTEQPV
ncbi:MAG: hypothetical protein MUF01_12545 [Bryobacterales bacterium]|jgi:hypothetical protein|nr:hypothetical protein [Bryobacterales bacterium]